ncbi:MAG: phenylacetate-CoA oxygenase subunit PaaJ [Actinobacteria bacterium]|nr:MAG: phenylacetate-CoA oxygenase subunit PaaJ [Actinomycetota bacterium]
MVSAVLSPERVRLLLDEVVDPEIPVLSIADIGILRGVAVDDEGRVTVTITPTYSGCPAMDLIRSQIRSVLAQAGAAEVTIATAFSPAWTTDWLTPEARRKLEESAIAPPGEPLCPRCRSAETRVVSEFGSTACKALLVCSSCGEPFDLFKEH